MIGALKASLAAMLGGRSNVVNGGGLTLGGSTAKKDRHGRTQAQRDRRSRKINKIAREVRLARFCDALATGGARLTGYGVTRRVLKQGRL